MKIYNTITGRKEEFIPLDGKNVKMYACGVTVYDLSHIGHARQAISYAMVADYLRYRGYNVKYVRNYTDVDDKIIKKANDLGKNAIEFSKEQIEETEKDMKNLHITDADIKPKASENIQNIIDFVSGLIEKGHAYADNIGNVYFDVRSFNSYGKLSHRNVDELLNGVRKEVEDGKRDPLDFALWKSAKPGEVYWESPWGKGRPGWHIECSAMVLNNLGETIDIHGGGKDLLFPHHENEVAQSEALTGKIFAKYWSHCGLVKINGEKMSKSLGNSLTIREALSQYNYEVIKYVMFSKHYTSDMDLLDKDFSLAESHLYYFYNTIQDATKFIKLYATNENVNNEVADNVIPKFIEVMDDDFNTAAAISELFGIFKYMNAMLKSANKSNRIETANILNKIIENIKEVYGGVLGLFNQAPEEFSNEMKNKSLVKLGIKVDFIENEISKRAEAKKIKDFNTADSIREQLEKSGILLKDTPEGTTWDIRF